MGLVIPSVSGAGVTGVTDGGTRDDRDREPYQAVRGEGLALGAGLDEPLRAGYTTVALLVGAALLSRRDVTCSPHHPNTTTPGDEGRPGV